MKEADTEAIHRAAREGNELAFLRLMVAGVPVDEPDLDGHTPLFHAIEGGHPVLVERLLACFRELNIVNRRANEAIREMARMAMDDDNYHPGSGRLRIFKLLLNEGAGLPPGDAFFNGRSSLRHMMLDADWVEFLPDERIRCRFCNEGHLVLKDQGHAYRRRHELTRKHQTAKEVEYLMRGPPPEGNEEPSSSDESDEVRPLLSSPCSHFVFFKVEEKAALPECYNCGEQLPLFSDGAGALVCQGCVPTPADLPLTMSLDTKTALLTHHSTALPLDIAGIIADYCATPPPPPEVTYLFIFINVLIVSVRLRATRSNTSRSAMLTTVSMSWATTSASSTSRRTARRRLFAIGAGLSSRKMAGSIWTVRYASPSLSLFSFFLGLLVRNV